MMTNQQVPLIVHESHRVYRLRKLDLSGNDLVGMNFLPFPYLYVMNVADNPDFESLPDQWIVVNNLNLDIRRTKVTFAEQQDSRSQLSELESYILDLNVIRAILMTGGRGDRIFGVDRLNKKCFWREFSQIISGSKFLYIL